MKILFITTISTTINAFLIPHIKLLVHLGHQVDVASNMVQTINQEITSLGCGAYNISFQRNPFSIKNCKAYSQIKKLVVEQQYDLIHTHTPVASFIVRFACRNFPNLQIIYTAHGFHFYKGASTKNWIIFYLMEKLAAKWTNSIITINDEDFRAASKLVIRENGKVFKVHGVGVDLNKFIPQSVINKKILRKKYGYDEEDFIIICIGELNYNKHQDLIIEATNVLREKIDKIKLLLVSNGSYKDRYNKLVQRLRISNNVEFLGFRNDIANLCSISDILVSSSRREGLPVNVMEAMASKTPVVVTNCRGNRDLVKDGENGFICNVNSHIDFAYAIEKLYKSEELRVKFGIKNLELIQEYSLTSVLKEMENIYKIYLGDSSENTTHTKFF